MRRILLLFPILFLLTHSVHAQDFLWVEPHTLSVNHAGTSGFTDKRTELSSAMDAEGNQYVMGYGDGLIEFGNGVSVDLDVGTYVAKFNPSGVCLWAKKLESPFGAPFYHDYDHAHNVDTYYEMEIDVDSSGNAYVLAPFMDHIQTSQDTFQAQGAADIFLGKLNTSGNWEWSEQLGGPTDHDCAFNLAVERDHDEVYIAGWFLDSMTIGNDTLTSIDPQSTDGFIAKFASDGSPLWARKHPSASVQNDRTLGLATGNGRVYCLNQVTPYSGMTDKFVTIYDTNGTVHDEHGPFYLNYNYSQTTTWELAAPLEADDQGNYYFGGRIDGSYRSMSIGSMNHVVEGSQASFLIKVDPSGDGVWGKTFGGNGPSPNYSAVNLLEDIAVDPDGNVYATGWYEDSCIIGGEDTLVMTINTHSIYNSQQFIAKFDPNGDLLYSAGNSMPGKGYSITANENGHVGFTGKSTQGAYGTELITDTAVVVGRIGGNLMQGVVFRDDDGDGSKDNGESAFSGAMVEVTPGPNYQISGNNGDYSVAVDSGTYSVDIPSPPPYFNSTNGPFSASFSGTNQVDTGNHLGLHVPTTVNDLKVTLTAGSPFRPGFDTRYYLTYENIGSSVLSDSLYLTLDPTLTFGSASPTEDQQSGNTLSWGFSNLAPLQSKTIEIDVSTPISATVGDTLHTSAIIEPVSGDSNAANNTDTSSREILASHDPNDKQVEPQSLTTHQVDNGTYLSYTVRFQNTGTDTAFNVMVRDTLSPKLDMSSFETLSKSHDGYAVVTENDPNVVDFKFHNILLPDSGTNELESHGFVKFRIRPETDLTAGEVVSNRVGIYFDYNDPVITNWAQTPIMEPSSLYEADGSVARVAVYPNPTEGAAILDLEAPANEHYSLRIYDLTGKELGSHPRITPGKNRIDLAALNAGVYFYKVSQRDGRVIGKGKLVVE